MLKKAPRSFFMCEVTLSVNGWRTTWHHLDLDATSMGPVLAWHQDDRLGSSQQK